MGKLCLIALMREIGLDKFNNMVAEARNQLAAEAKWANRGHLEELFDTQIATLEDRGVPAPIVRMLYNQRGQVITKASEMAFENGRVPFLPVIPRAYLSIYSQMPMVLNGKNMVGYTNLVPTTVTDTDMVDTPENPYYIYDIEDGELMRDKAPQDAEELIENQGRLGLTEVEVIALGVHTDVLSRHYVDAVGSLYDDCTGIYLRLYVGLPELDHSSRNISDPMWGAASCGSRA